MKKKYYLEAMRILAVLLVMYNHSAPFMSFATQSGLEKNVSFLLSLICKAAVPLFFMISGVLLLGKEESFRDLFQKRILRMIYVIIIFSLLYHFKMAWKGATPFAPLHVFLRLPFDLVFLPYWYLYSYIGFLAILPFVRAIAKHMTKNMLYYLILLQILTESLAVTCTAFGYPQLCGYFSAGGMIHMFLFYPLVGYGLDKYIEEEHFGGKWNLLRNLSFFAVALVTWKMVYLDAMQNDGIYREMRIGTWIQWISIILFINVKILFSEKRLTEPMKKMLSLFGGCVFGIYLLDGFIGTGGTMDVIYLKLMPYISYLPAFLVEILVVFFMRFVLAYTMKKLPVFRKLL